MKYNWSYLALLLKHLDLFNAFNTGYAGVIEGNFKFLDVGRVLFLNTDNLGLVASFGLNKSSLEFFNCTLSALSEIQKMYFFLLVNYERTSMVRTLMARLPRLFRTRS